MIGVWSTLHFRENFFQSGVGFKKALFYRTALSLLSDELMVVATSGGAQWEQISRARWCQEPAGHIWWLFILTGCGLVPREIALYQGIGGFPWVCLSVLLHPEVQPHKVKGVVLRKRQDSAKPLSLADLNPQC